MLKVAESKYVLTFFFAQDAFCRGAVCWRSSFALGAGLQALALLVGLLLAWNTY